VFRGEWRYNEMRHRWEGNPVRSGDIDDLMAAIKHKIKASGTPRMHSAAMKIEYMDMMLTWAKSRCPFDVAFRYIGLAMGGSKVPPPGEALSAQTHADITRHLGQLAFHSTAWTLWTRCALPLRSGIFMTYM